MADLSVQAPFFARTKKSAYLTGSVVFALCFAVYAPILYYLKLHWDTDANYSHGYIIVPLAIYFAWEKIPKIKRARIRPSWLGVIPFALATLSLMLGRLGGELMTMRMAFVLSMIGIVLLVFGRKIFEIIWFPLFFLFLMIPLPESVLNIIAFPLQLIAADQAVQALQYLGVPVLREGNIIHLPSTQLFVAEACSGLRSLMALLTLGVVFAHFYRNSLVEQIIIVASTIPIAIVVNAFRVGLTGWLTHHHGIAAAEGVIHEMQGLFTFSLAFVILLLEASLLSRIRDAYKGRQDRALAEIQP